MNCWACGEELIWGGDNDDESEIYLIETNLSCSNCEAVVIVYHGKGENYEDEDERSPKYTSTNTTYEPTTKAKTFRS